MFMLLISMVIAAAYCGAMEVGSGLGGFSLSADSIQKMSGSLYLEEVSLSPDRNIILSPLSIHLAMSMLYYGAGGRSKEELGHALGLTGVSKEEHLESVSQVLAKYRGDTADNIQLNIANGLVLDEDLATVKPVFKELVTNQFDGDVIARPGSSTRDIAKAINAWVADKTKNNIKEVVTGEGIGASINIALINAVYFNAKWFQKFNKDDTRREVFTTSKGPVQTDFMFLSSNLEFAESEELSARIVAIPYVNKDYKMIILHPKESSSIDHLEMALFNNSQASSTIGQYLGKMKNVGVDLALPKFTSDSDIQLSKHFQKLGVLDVFGAGADLSGISDLGGGGISDIVHRTKLVVDEEGSEASAATTVFATKMFIPNIEVMINSPFIFYILDISNHVPIFVGKIVNPTAEGVVKEDLQNVIDADDDEATVEVDYDIDGAGKVTGNNLV